MYIFITLFKKNKNQYNQQLLINRQIIVFFREIIGHKEIKQKLINTIHEKRISHALLFVGPEGNGKLALAIAYARYVSCLNRGENDSCGKCRSCVKYKKLIHPDLHFVFPVIRTTKITKPLSDDFIKIWRKFVLDTPYGDFNVWLERIGTEKQQAGIFTQESQSIIKKLYFKTYEAEYKIMIIWMPEKMNQTASNKLLKMIEEPPPKTLFILVAENTERMLKTILSRTQIVQIPRIDDKSMFSKIKEKYSFNDDKIKEIVRMSYGNYFMASEIINTEGNGASENFKIFVNFMRMCYSMKVLELVKWTEEMSNLGREQQKLFLRYILRMLRENFILNILPEQQNKLVFLTKKEKNFSEKFCKFIHTKNINQLSEEFTKAYLHIERYGFDKLVFLDLALKTIRLLKLKDEKRN